MDALDATRLGLSAALPPTPDELVQEVCDEPLDMEERLLWVRVCLLPASVACCSCCCCCCCSGGGSSSSGSSVSYCNSCVGDGGGGRGSSLAQVSGAGSGAGSGSSSD